MKISEYERILQSANPRLRIKRYGTGKAGVHLGNEYVCRVPQGEITAYTVTRPEIGHASQFVSQGNPTGRYIFPRILRRGRNGVAKILLHKRLIKHSDLARLSC
jgi:hypothetical protein